jgi:hypothetical protein
MVYLQLCTKKCHKALKKRQVTAMRTLAMSMHLTGTRGAIILSLRSTKKEWFPWIGYKQQGDVENRELSSKIFRRKKILKLFLGFCCLKPLIARFMIWNNQIII